MPRYLHIPHTPDTARTLTLSGRNCLVVSGIVTPPKIGYRRGKGRRGEMCPQGTQKSHSGAAACLVAYLCVHASQKQYNYEESYNNHSRRDDGGMQQGCGRRGYW